MVYNPSIKSGAAADANAGSGTFGPGGGAHIIAGTAETLQPKHNGGILYFTNAGAIALTVPPGLGAPFECGIIQAGAGQVTVAATSPATVNNRQSQTKTAGQWAEIALVAAVADTFVLSGDGA